MHVIHLERKFTSPTETFIVNQINALYSHKHSVFTVKNLGNLFVAADIVEYNKNSFLFPTKFLTANARDYFIYKATEIKPNLIHCHYLTDALFFSPFTEQINVPKICSCYGYDVSNFPKKFGGLARLLFRKVFEDYNLFLAMSEDMKRDLIEIGCDARKILVHYHGIDTRKFAAIRRYSPIRSEFNILTIASLFPFKGHIVALKALRQLRSERPDITFIYNIVGGGPKKRSLEKYVSANGLGQFVKFHDPVKHGPLFQSFLDQAHVFLHPSVTASDGAKEGIPGAIVEAMASGLPVISSFHAGIPSAIENEVTGLLVKEHDFNSICHALIRLYENPELRFKLGKNATHFASTHLDLYKKAITLTEIYKTEVSSFGVENTVDFII